MAKLTTEERDRVLEFLEKGHEGDSVDHEGRMVEISNMVGGRYLLYVREEYTDILGNNRERWEVAGQADEEMSCLHFLNTGRHWNRERKAWIQE